jgi:TM2 domain-containing membrane protein YozV
MWFSASKTSSSDLMAKDTIKSNDIDPLTPAKAFLFSCGFPGLGQTYSKKILENTYRGVAIGTSLFFILIVTKV